MHPHRNTFLFLIAFLVGALRLPAQQIAASDSARLETVEKYLAASHAEELYRKTVSMMLEAVSSQGSVGDIMQRFMEKYLPYETIKTDYIKVYRESISETDMQALITFFESDVGQRFVVRMPFLMAATNRLMQARMQEHMPELVAELMVAAQARPPE